jgi:hypothetical protein
MNPDAITGWLASPAAIPDTASINNAVREWPWFVPVRMMEAVRKHQQTPFSEKALAKLRLYSNDWLPAYTLLLQNTTAAESVTGIKEVEGFTVSTDSAADPASDRVDQKQVSEEDRNEKDQPFIQPVYTEDYFRHQGIITEKQEPKAPQPTVQITEQPQTLMVVMSFAEWLTHFKTKTQKDQEEAQAKSVLRSMWQQEKLAAALEDEPEEIPEDVFEMAVSSITREDDIASESLAQIYERQEKWSAAADMYRKLALKYPAKSTYFATRAEAAKKRLL